MACVPENCTWAQALEAVKESEEVVLEANQALAQTSDDDRRRAILSAGGLISLSLLEGNQKICDGESCKVERSFAQRATQLASDPVLDAMYNQIYNPRGSNG